jgi:hypothetical protein
MRKAPRHPIPDPPATAGSRTVIGEYHDNVNFAVALEFTRGKIEPKTQ